MRLAQSIDKTSFLKHLDNIITYLFYIFIFLLPISKATTEIFFTLIFLIWIFKKIFSKGRLKEWFPKTDLNLLLFLFLIICFLTIFNSVEPKESLRGFWGKWFQWIMTYFIFVDSINAEKKFAYSLKILSIGYFIILLDGVYQFITGRDFFCFLPLENSRWITSTLKNLNTYGGYLALISPITIFFIGNNINLFYFRLFLLLIIPLFLFNLFFTNSASLWIALSISSFLVFLFLRKKIKKINILFLLFPLLLFFTLFLIPIFRERIFSLCSQLDLNKGGRFPIWRDTLREIIKNPFLGKGINTTRGFIVKKYSSSLLLIKYAHIHNLFLHIALETGIIGLFIFCWIIYKILKTVFSFTQRNGLISYGLFISFVSFLITNIFDTHIGEQIFTLFWIIVGVIMVYKNLNKNIK